MEASIFSDEFMDDRKLFVLSNLPVDYIEFKHYIIVSYDWFKQQVNEE